MVQMGTNIFFFTFFHLVEDQATTYEFNILANNEADIAFLTSIDRGECEEFNDLVSDLEGDYGVHDVGFSNNTEFYGFNTYEVEADKYDELIGKWRQFFTDHGLTLTPTEIDVE